MVLNKIREKIEPKLGSIGLTLNHAGISPNFLTVLGFAFSVSAGLLFVFKPNQTYLAGIALIFAGFMDVLDGSVARAGKKVGRRGSFADSTMDRISEIAIYAGIVGGGEALPLLVVLTLGFSMVVSYLRAKGESLNVKVAGVGIGERAERLLVLIAFSIIGFVWIGIYVVLLLAVVTVVHRYYEIAKELAGPPLGQ